MKELKKQLFDLCSKYVEDKISTLEETIMSAQQSANQESKSSMGDKYETGRAMAQLEIEKCAKQLSEATKMKEILQKLSSNIPHTHIQFGSIVSTNQGNYYISIGAGPLKINEEVYMAVSMAAPITKSMLGLLSGDHFSFQGRSFTILAVA